MKKSHKNPKDRGRNDQTNDQTDKLSTNPFSDSADNDQDLGFEATEATGGDMEPLGEHEDSETDNDLDIQNPSDLVNQESSDSYDRSHQASEDSELIGESAHPQQQKTESSDEFQKEIIANAGSQDGKEYQDNAGRGGLEKLSDDRVNEITSKMKGTEESSDFLTEREKRELMSKLDSVEDDGDVKQNSRKALKGQGFGNSPIVPPKKAKQSDPTDVSSSLLEQPALDDEHRPKMAKRARGIAYFYRNFIQILGEQELHDDDDISVNGRQYTLKKKQASPKFLAAVLVPVAAIAMFMIGAFFSSDADTGHGTVVGFALNEEYRPLITGAQIRFPESGKVFQTNGQGFFNSGPIESGSQKIEYIVDGETITTDYVTIVSGKVTTIALRPDDEYLADLEPTEPITTPAEIVQTPAPPSNASSISKPASSQTSKKKSSSNKKSKKTKTTASKWARLNLNADVSGAKLTIDGSVVGAGNVTYGKLRSGKRSYIVSKDGYQPSKGTIELPAGKTTTLNVSLTPATAEQKATSYENDDYFYSGVDNLEQGRFDDAIADFTEAINLRPSYAQAYLHRAQGYESILHNRDARNDYIRAAEIMQFKGNDNEAISAYNQAIEIDAKSVAAYLGRGNLYLARSEEIAAIADYDMVVNLDKRNLQGHMGLGKARLNQGYHKKATKHFKNARSIDQNNPQIHQWLMLSYLGEGNTKQVNKSYQKFIKCASEEEIARLQNSSKFSAALRVIKD
ncbi:MAG: hypothetical protein DRP45_00050 [Candidatus Zixiibacteriota bacterium]|nr:MAG: hypothetical protein DRP45_00050 [candidate division Zixibacteria bacterium]